MQHGILDWILGQKRMLLEENDIWVVFSFVISTVLVVPSALINVCWLDKMLTGEACEGCMETLYAVFTTLLWL